MSKLIVEMEMPRNCDECDVNYDCAFCGITGSAFYGNTQMPNFMPDEQKLPDCPIKGVLPDEHGDLIDKDEMHKKIRLWKSTATDTITIGFLYYIEELLMAERPIIAAERKDDARTGNSRMEQESER